MCLVNLAQGSDNLIWCDWPDSPRSNDDQGVLDTIGVWSPCIISKSQITLSQEKNKSFTMKTLPSAYFCFIFHILSPSNLRKNEKYLPLEFVALTGNWTQDLKLTHFLGSVGELTWKFTPACFWLWWCYTYQKKLHFAEMIFQCFT